MQVASVCWDVGCVEVQPKHKMTNRCAALEEEDDGEMAHPPRLAETYGVCAVQKFQKIKRVEVTVVPRRVCGQPSCCKRSPRWKEEAEEKGSGCQEKGHYGQRRSSLEERRAA